MLYGKLLKKLLLFTLPIALSSIVQQLFNAADTAVVGHFSNANALAAVGTNTETIALIVTVSSGLSIGVNVLIANLIGRKESQHIPMAVQTAVLLSILFGLTGLFFGQAVAAPLLRLIRTPEHIFHSAKLYLRIYLLGYPFLLLYDFGSAILRARGDSRYPFLALVVSGAANIGLNLFFVIVFHMGGIRRCFGDGRFQWSFGIPCADSFEKRWTVPLAFPEVAWFTSLYRRNFKNGDSVGCAGGSILSGKHFCAGIGEPLRGNGDCRKHHRYEF